MSHAPSFYGFNAQVIATGERGKVIEERNHRFLVALPSGRGYPRWMNEDDLIISERAKDEQEAQK